MRASTPACLAVPDAADEFQLALDGADGTDDGVPDLSGRDVTYVGQSFGGIYGTMLAGVDDRVARSVLDSKNEKGPERAAN